MWKRSWTPFVKNPEFFQQLRTTFVVKRVNEAPLPSVRRAPSLRARHFVYETLEDNNPKVEEMQILLKKYVEDVGMPGDLVTLKPKTARYLILTKAATYKSPENIEAAGEVRSEDSYSSIYAATTVKLLSKFILNISMNAHEPWTLEPWHIRSAFRKAHIHVPDYAFTMPRDTINGPDMELEGKEFIITVTLNKTEKVPVRCRIHHWSTKKEQRLAPIRDHWRFPAETIFPEDKILGEQLPEMIAPVFTDNLGPPHMRPKKTVVKTLGKKKSSSIQP